MFVTCSLLTVRWLLANVSEIHYVDYTCISDILGLRLQKQGNQLKSVISLFISNQFIIYAVLFRVDTKMTFLLLAVLHFS